jgi:hypothetical protein
LKSGREEQIFQPIPADDYTTPSPGNANRYIIGPNDKQKDTTTSIKRVTSPDSKEEQSEQRGISREKKDSADESITKKRKNKKRR